MARERPQLQVNPPPPVEENRESTLTSDDPQECKTPTSRDHKIPPILSCPSAPKNKDKEKYFHRRENFKKRISLGSPEEMSRFLLHIKFWTSSGLVFAAWRGGVRVEETELRSLFHFILCTFLALMMMSYYGICFLVFSFWEEWWMIRRMMMLSISQYGPYRSWMESINFKTKNITYLVSMASNFLPF